MWLRDPFTSGFTITPKYQKNVKDFPRSAFYSTNTDTLYPNRKILKPGDPFNKSQAPILTFHAQLDDRGACPRDQMKFRNCNIFYFVEDGTIKVFEPQQKNVGFLQRVLISRNRISKPDGTFYNLDDLNIGETVSLYGKKFKIVDCDVFTKKYLSEMGYRVRTPEPAVIDPVYADRQEKDMHRTYISKPQQKHYKLATFLKTYPKKLRFYAIYNNKPVADDEIRYASLYYDLANGTIKIVDEQKMLNYQSQLAIGNYDTFLILKPTLVPKRQQSINPIGRTSKPVILNLSVAASGKKLHELMSTRAGGANNEQGFLRDPNPEIHASEEEEYYTEKDFDLGKTINVFGYEVYLYDCDEFTKEFYRDRFFKELVPVPLPVTGGHAVYHTVVYKEQAGSKEHSLQSVKDLPLVNVPKRVIKAYELSEKPRHKGTEQLLKYFLNCRRSNEGNVLTFLSRVITQDPLFKDQHYMIRFYLEDDTFEISLFDFSVSEPLKGIKMKRKKLSKPRSELENAGACYYGPSDLFVGNNLHALKKTFLLVDADEYTFDYMERNCETFLHSNIKRVISDLFPVIRDKSCSMTSSFEASDPHHTGTVTYNDFRNTLMDLIPDDKKQLFPEHQLKTLARQYAHDDDVGLKIERLASMMQRELQKQKFCDFEKLKMHFRVFDLDNRENKGHFKPSRVYEILRSYPLHIDRDLLRSFAFKMQRCNGLVSYEEVMEWLNYLKNPIVQSDFTPRAININWERVEKMKNVNKISYFDFLRDLTTERCPNCE